MAMGPGPGWGSGGGVPGQFSHFLLPVPSSLPVFPDTHAKAHPVTLSEVPHYLLWILGLAPTRWNKLQGQPQAAMIEI